jgi:hypothetical protein
MGRPFAARARLAGTRSRPLLELAAAPSAIRPSPLALGFEQWAMRSRAGRPERACGMDVWCAACWGELSSAVCCLDASKHGAFPALPRLLFVASLVGSRRLRLGAARGDNMQLHASAAVLGCSAGAEEERDACATPACCCTCMQPSPLLPPRPGRPLTTRAHAALRASVALAACGAGCCSLLQGGRLARRRS